MTIRALIPVVGLALALGASACSESTSSASVEAPLPTIGLGSQTGEGLIGDAVAGADTVTDVDTVVMIGDSITVGSEPALTSAFQQLGFDEIVIQAQNSKRTAVSSSDNTSGVRIAEGLVALEPDADRSGELWVVALGTNDIDQYAEADIGAFVDEMLAVVPAESPLVWVDTYFRDRPDGAAAVNAVIRERVAARGNAVVAAWSGVAGGEGVLRSDGLHPGDDGTYAFAATVADAIVVLLDLR